jgi:PhzF family phenazine biosynthesis protein
MSSPSSFQYSVIDAFSTTPFGGNPAAVVVLDNETMHTFTDDLMQKIAAEFNLSETAFITPTLTPGTFGLRWFTPTDEINLCGHGTLASGFALSLRPEYKDIELFKFNTLSGELTTRKLEDGSLEMNFPALVPEKVSAAEYAEYEACVQRAIKGISKPRIVDISAAEKFLVIQFDESESENLGNWTVDTDALVSGPCSSCLEDVLH